MSSTKEKKKQRREKKRKRGRGETKMNADIVKVHIQGYPGKHYCPRMATMNKPTYLFLLPYCFRFYLLIFFKIFLSCCFFAINFLKTICISSYYVPRKCNNKLYLNIDKNMHPLLRTRHLN
jgi:hypothetical protein